MITGLLLSMVLSGPAMAQGAGQQDARAREMFITGQHLYQEGRYRDALVAFESAYRLGGRPNILRSLAYCHENLGETERALDGLSLPGPRRRQDPGIGGTFSAENRR